MFRSYLDSQQQKVHVKVELGKNHLIGDSHKDTGGAVGYNTNGCRVGQRALRCSRRHFYALLIDEGRDRWWGERSGCGVRRVRVSDVVFDSLTAVAFE